MSNRSDGADEQRSLSPASSWTLKRGDGRAILAALVILVAVGLLDDLTPVDVDLGLFYMLPVLLVAWTLGRKAGLAFVVLAVLTQFVIDTAVRAAPPNVSAFNAVSRTVVLAALALVMDRMYEERARWRKIDQERDRLLRLLERELPRPLRALDWFSRTFDEALENRNIESVRGQLRSVRHYLRQVRFLANDVVAVGRVDSGAVVFERQPFDLVAAVREAADEALDRRRVALSVSPDSLTVLGDPDCLRHAVASVLGRALELSPQDVIRILVRPSAHESAVEINCGAVIDDADLELAELLVTGIGGRLTTQTTGARGMLITVRLPLAEGGAGAPPDRRNAEARSAPKAP